MRYFRPASAFADRSQLYGEALDVLQDAIVCDGISIFELVVGGAELEFVATRTIARDLLKGLELRLGTGIAGQAAARGEGMIANDVHAHPDFFALPDRTLRFETRSVLCSPMRHGGAVVGVIELVNRVDGRAFTPAELASIQALADGVAAYWHGGGADRGAFYDLTRMVRKVVDVEGVSVFTVDAAGTSLDLRFSDTTRKTGLLGRRLPIDHGVAGAVAREAGSVLVENVRQEPRFFQGVDAESMFATHSIVAAPMVFSGRVLGVVELVNARGSESFTEDDREVLETVAGELAERLQSMGDRGDRR